jgi:hypothetical protein
MTTLQRVARVVNRVVLPLVSGQRLRWLTGGRMTVVGYVGRRSGRFVELPVAFRRDADGLAIDVAFPEQKTWWHNFTGAGADISLAVDGVDRAGRAVAVRDGDQVIVRVALAEPPAPAH